MQRVNSPPEEDNPENTENASSGDAQNGKDSNQLSITMQSHDGNAIAGICTLEKQGELCVAAFKAAMPAGYTEAFSFNLNLDVTGMAKCNYDKKSGRLVIRIPKQYQESGRKFALIGIDKYGKTKIFYDSDLDDATVAVNLDIEGYAFSLIYSDFARKSNTATATATATNGTYVVKSGDSLSQIALMVKKSVDFLADMNGIENVDNLSVGQVVKY